MQWATLTNSCCYVFTGLFPRALFLEKGRSWERNCRPLQASQKETKNCHGVSVTKGKFFQTTCFSSRDVKAQRPSEIARYEIMHNLSFLSHFTQRQFIALMILGCVRGHVTSRWGIPPPPPPFSKGKALGKSCCLRHCFTLFFPHKSQQGVGQWESTCWQPSSWGLGTVMWLVHHFGTPGLCH